MNNEKYSSLSFLDNYSSLLEALQFTLGISKSSIKKIISEKKVLKQKIIAKKEYQIDINAINRFMINPRYEGGEISILYENPNFIVLNKAWGVHTHPLNYVEKDNCLSFLRNNGYHQELRINQESYDRGLLFRLDKVTSGVLIYVKNESLYQHLRENYSKLVKKKKYLAIVCGRLGINKKLEQYFRSSEKKGKKIQVSDEYVPDSRKGILEVRPVSYNKDEDLTLVEVDLITGLRHQIRAQLAHFNYPLLGDEFYGGRKACRVFLHAYNYALESEGIKLDIVCREADLFESFFNFDTCL